MSFTAKAAKIAKMIAKIAGIAIIAKIFPRVADSHRTVFNFGNYPSLAILAIHFAPFAVKF
jgi:ABC-type proline/glycine betaine transport system permease subunit